MDARTLLLLDGGTASVPSTVSKLSTDRQIFRRDGKPHLIKGVTAFRLMDRHASQDDIEPFVDAFDGYNQFVVFGYTPVKDWGVSAWDWPRLDDTKGFIEYCLSRGWDVQLVLLTDDDPARIPQAVNVVNALGPMRYPNLLLRIGNEPTTHKMIDTRALQAACEASGYLYSSGDYEDSWRFFGGWLDYHSARDPEWVRRAHDAIEYYAGGGPNAPSDPAHRVPCLAGEPPKPQDVGGDKVRDFLAYFGSASILGCGAVFHCESGKMAAVPNEEERRCAAAALRGMNAFPADAALMGYRRIDEQGRTLRTYVAGNSMVRIRPTTAEAPESGWRDLTGDAILWTRS